MLGHNMQCECAESPGCRGPVATVDATVAANAIASDYRYMIDRLDEETVGVASAYPCCARFRYGDGTHDLGCPLYPKPTWGNDMTPMDVSNLEPVVIQEWIPLKESSMTVGLADALANLGAANPALFLRACRLRVAAGEIAAVYGCFNKCQFAIWWDRSVPPYQMVIRRAVLPDWLSPVAPLPEPK